MTHTQAPSHVDHMRPQHTSKHMQELDAGKHLPRPLHACTTVLPSLAMAHIPNGTGQSCGQRSAVASSHAGPPTNLLMGACCHP